MSDAVERIEFGGCQRRLVDEVDQRIQVLVAGHRNVPPVLIVDAPERRLVEAVDVDDEIERLANRQEIGKDKQLLRLFITLVAEAEGDELLVLEQRALPQVVFEAARRRPGRKRRRPIHRRCR